MCTKYVLILAFIGSKFKRRCKTKRRWWPTNIQNISAVFHLLLVSEHKIFIYVGIVYLYYNLMQYLLALKYCGKVINIPGTFSNCNKNKLQWLSPREVLTPIVAYFFPWFTQVYLVISKSWSSIMKIVMSHVCRFWYPLVYPYYNFILMDSTIPESSQPFSIYSYVGGSPCW